MLDLTWLNLLSVCDIKEALIARTHLVPLLPVCDNIIKGVVDCDFTFLTLVSV